MKPGPSRVPIGTYNRGASRVPASKAPTRAPESTTTRPAASKAPTSSRVPSSTTAPSHRLSVAPSTYKPKTAIHSPPFQASNVSTTKPAMSMQDYLKRGTPKNVNASAFYDNADGAEARAQLGFTSAIPSQVPFGTIRPSPFESRTQAPPADAPSLELEEKMGGVTLSPKSVRPQPTVKPGGSTQRPSERPSSSPSRRRLDRLSDNHPQWLPSHCEQHKDTRRTLFTATCPPLTCPD
jgi:hypothetical protein